jgi:hypothetical protein
MPIARGIEDFFRGFRLVAGVLIAIGIVVLAGLVLVAGVLVAFTYDAPGVLVRTVLIAAGIVGIPTLLFLLGRRLRSSG